MGFLYPRLLSAQATRLHKEYVELTIAELNARAATHHDAAVYVATGGDRIPEQGLEDLRAKVVALAKEAGFPGESDRRLRADFDLGLAVVLHSQMEIVPAEAAAGDVWAFLALVLLPDVAYWRYPMPPGDRVLNTDITRHTFGRLWWRAELVHSPDSPAPYSALNVLGEAAFDQIYARRRALGASPYLVTAIIRVWYELDLGGLDEREVLRDFLKRLLRLGSFMLFESLAEQHLHDELRAAARASIAAVHRSSGVEPDLESRVDLVKTESVGVTFADFPHGVASTVGDQGNPQKSRPGFPIATNDRPTQGNADREPPLSPYKAYAGPGFGDPRELSVAARADAIAAVVAIEGPVKARRVFRILTQLAGRRLRRSAEVALVEATKHAIRTGKIEVQNQRGRSGYIGATLRAPGQPTVLLRTRGPRDLDEIPEDELTAAALRAKGNEVDIDLDVLAKRTSLLFGYERSTDRFRDAIADALAK